MKPYAFLEVSRGGGNCNCNYSILQYIAIIELQLLISEIIIIAIAIGKCSGNCNLFIIILGYVLSIMFG